MKENKILLNVYRWMFIPFAFGIGYVAIAFIGYESAYNLDAILEIPINILIALGLINGLYFLINTWRNQFGSDSFTKQALDFDDIEPFQEFKIGRFQYYKASSTFNTIIGILLATIYTFCFITNILDADDVEVFYGLIAMNFAAILFGLLQVYYSRRCLFAIESSIKKANL